MTPVDRRQRTRRNSHRRIAVAVGLVTFLAVVTAAPAFAAGSDSDSRVISDRWMIFLGSYLPDFKTDASVGSGAVVGTLIRAEDELGLDDNASMFRAEGFYRFNSRHAIGYGYWSFARDGDASIGRIIDFDGHVFDIGAELETSFDTRWIRADWRYSFLRTDRGETGISIGLSTYKFDISVAGMASIDDGMGNTILEAARGDESLLAPVPTLGMFVNFAVTPTILFRAWFNVLDLDVGDIEGKLTEGATIFEWYPSSHVGVGGGLSRTEIDYKQTGDDPYSFDYNLSGFLAYVTFAWGGTVNP